MPACQAVICGTHTHLLALAWHGCWPTARAPQAQAATSAALHAPPAAMMSSSQLLQLPAAAGSSLQPPLTRALPPCR